MSQNFADRRKHKRIPIVTLIQTRQKGADESCPVMLVDLSAGGARILSQFPIDAGDRLELTIPLYEMGTVTCPGKVVWALEMNQMKSFKFGVEYMAGVQFEQESTQISRFVESYI